MPKHSYTKTAKRTGANDRNIGTSHLRTVTGGRKKLATLTAKVIRRK